MIVLSEDSLDLLIRRAANWYESVWKQRGPTLVLSSIVPESETNFFPMDDLDEKLFPKVAVGSKLTVWCLEFPPQRRDGKIWTRLLEEVEVEIVMIEQQDHPPDPSTTALIQRIEARDGKKLPQKPFRCVLGKNASGRSFHTHVAMQFPEKDRIEPNFVVPDSIKSGGGSPEWWTPELFQRNGWHLLEDD